MRLKEIYKPIREELAGVERMIERAIENSDNTSILKLGKNLLNPGGKKLRPALVILCAKANNQYLPLKHELTKIASAVELIHLASLIHDDVIDHSEMRHNKPTINSRWGGDVSIALGDYLYSIGFDLVSSCKNADILSCISQATRLMCEGELVQVYERDNLSLLKERYITIVKKKTASLFAASCQAGALLSDSPERVRNGLRDYGLNFGVAFQITDDYMDLTGEERLLGKRPGQDIKVGEITLPLMNLLESVPIDERKKIETLLTSERSSISLEEIRSRFFNSDAGIKTKKEVLAYVASAKESLAMLSGSPYKESLLVLADFIAERGFRSNI